MNKDKILILIILVMYFSSSCSKKNDDLPYADVESARKVIKDVKNYWREGDYKKELRNNLLSCKDLLGSRVDYSRKYLQCNPRFMECVLKEMESRKVLQLTKNDITDDGLYIEFTLEKDQNPIPLYLEDKCHEASLPERFYEYKKSDGTSFIWSSISRNIKLDKLLVTYNDIALWKKKTKRDDIHIPVTLEQYDRPAGNLSIKQMEDFCQFQGKQLMRSHVFDAGAAIPLNLDDVKMTLAKGSRYPWTRKNKDSAIEAGKGFGLVSESICRRIYSKECLEYPFVKSFSDSVGWIGMGQVLGGVLEYVVNDVEPKMNINASSFYHSINSSWHQISKRVSWNGEDNSFKSIDWKELPPRNENIVYEIGFRCMREDYHE